MEIKEELLAAHHNFISETDSEVVLRLIEHYYSESQEIEVSILKCLKRLKGSFALGVFSTKGPQSLYLAKRKSPVIIGKGKEENLFASDLIALTPHTEEFIFLEDEQIAILTEQDIHIKNFDGKFVSLETKRLANLEQSSSSKGTFKHYMLKEIFEQGDMIQRHIESFYSEEKGSLRDNVLGLEGLNISEFKQLIFLGCGSAFYSARAGEYFLEDILPFPISTQLASEFRYRKTALCPKTLIIALSQSGETGYSGFCRVCKKPRVYCYRLMQHPLLISNQDVRLYSLYASWSRNRSCCYKNIHGNTSGSHGFTKPLCRRIRVK